MATKVSFKKTSLFGLLALLAWTQAMPARAAAPTVEQMLMYRPRQKDVILNTPGAEEAKTYTVQPAQNSAGKVYGWLLVDGQKKTVRRFLDVNGDNNIDIWSYYKDGIEIYREIDSNYNGKADQYRWFNTAGMKWGVDTNEDGAVDTWRLISAEEVGQEIFTALTTNNITRLQALFISEAEMGMLKLPAKQIERMKALQAQAGAKWQKILADGKISSSTFVRVESAVPHCTPADSFGTETDVLRYTSRSVLFEITEKGEKKMDFLHLGEMIQVGLAWRLVDLGGESQNPNPGGSETSPSPAPTDPKLRDLLANLEKFDKVNPMIVTAENDTQAKIILDRVKMIEEIAGLDVAANRETWIKQLLDNLCTAAQVEKGTYSAQAMTRLEQYKDQYAKSMAGSNLAGYAHYRHITAEYMPKLNKPDAKADLVKLQSEWQEQLSKFVQAYPKAEDTGDALIQMAMTCEFTGKDQEAIRWYKQISGTFPEGPLAPKADGAVRRLESIGKKMDLTGPQLGTGAPFNLNQLQGKVVVVYYWATYCESCPKEFAQLRKIHGELAAKGLELVCVNLDDKSSKATQFLTGVPVPGIHLFELNKDGQGGLDSPYAVRYGINGLPTMFLVDRNGNVIRHGLQINELEDALKKAL